jgi:hypothetical protein
MLRLFFGRHLGPEACRSLVSEARADAQRHLAQYQAIRHDIEQDQSHQQDRSYWLLTVSAGEHTARATIAWAEQALTALDQMDAPCDPPKDRTRR